MINNYLKIAHCSIKKLTALLVLFAFVLVSSFSSASTWSWSIDNVADTFSATESDQGNTVAGSVNRLSNGFIEMTVGSSSGPNALSAGTKFYPVEVPGFFLAVPPILSYETQLAVTVTAGSCPLTNKTYNWIFSGWGSSHNMSLNTQAAFGKFSWDVGTNQATINTLYNVTSFTQPSWFPGDLLLDTDPCLNGVSRIVGPAGTDRRGTLYLSEEGGMVYRTEANHTILGVPQVTIASEADLAGVYSLYFTKIDGGASLSDKIKPVRLLITGGGNSRGDAFSNVISSERDSGWSGLRLNVTSINSPENGMVQGTITRGGNTGSVSCIYQVHSTTSQKVLFCAGQDTANNALPANLIMVSQPLYTKDALTCQSGSIQSTCTISSPQALADGAEISANNLVIASGGSLTSTGEIRIELLGDLTIQSGGNLSADIKELVVRDFTLQTGGTFSGNIEKGLARNFTVQSSSVLSANGLGGNGGVGGASGSGSGAGLGPASTGCSFGGSGGTHGGLGGVGDDCAVTASAYGSSTLPATLGSGGGGGTGTTGGNGGGVIHLDIGSTLQVDGTISANGTSGANGSGGNSGGGGGSGGSVYLRANTLSGSGYVQADGGNAGTDSGSNRCGGGGGGGRVAILATNNSFTYSATRVTADAGTGDDAACGAATNAQAGNEGSVYWNPAIPDISELTTTNLVARYYLDEAASGTTPTTVFDASSTGFNLTLDYGTSDLNYTSSDTGRGLDFVETAANGSARAMAQVESSAVNLNGNTKAVIEAVIEPTQCQNSPSHLFWIGANADNGELTLSCQGSSLRVYTHNTLRLTYPVGTWAQFGKKIVHVVYDSTEGTGANRIKLYVDGLQVKTADSFPTSNQTLAIATTDRLVIGNSQTGTENFQGKVHYVALYNNTLAADVLLSHTERLFSGHDGDLVTVSIASTESSPTTASSIPMTVSFNQNVTGFVASDIVVTNGSVASFAGSGKDYTFNIVSPNTTVSVNIAAGVAENASGISNIAATPFSIDYTGTPVSTTLTSSESTGSTANPVPYTVTFSESVTGITLSDFTASSGTLGSLAGSGATYTFQVSNPSAGELTVSVAAGAGTSGSGVSSQAASLTFYHGVRRRSSGLVALYEFNEAGGSVVSDTSETGSNLSLGIETPGNTTWSTGYLTLNSGTLIRPAGAASKIYNECSDTNEISVEAWLRPANTSMSGPARILTMSESTTERNFTLGANGTSYRWRLRSTGNNTNGTSPEMTINGLTTSKQHVVVTVGTDGQKVSYINGTQIGTQTTAGNFSGWNNTHTFALGQEINGSSSYLGDYYLVAVYCKELLPSEVSLHYSLGSEALSEPTSELRGDHLEVNFNEPSGSSSFKDMSGNSYNVTCSNCPTTGSTGILGNGASFDGVNDFVTSSGGSDISDPYTLSAWFRTTSSSAGSFIYVGTGNDDEYYNLGMNSDGNVVWYYSHTPTDIGDGVDFASPGTYNDGQWHYAVGVRDGARIGKLYVDGVLIEEDTDNSGSNSQVNGTNVYIGRNPSTGQYFQGDIDEVHIFDSAPTGKDILNEYRKIKEITGPNEFPKTIGALKAWFDPSDSLNLSAPGNKIKKLNDKSGNFLHLTQDSDGLKPLLVPNAINGLAAMEFDGTDDYLEHLTTAITTQPATIFMVFKPTEPNTSNVLIDGIGANWNENRNAIELSSDGAIWSWAGGGNTVSSGAGSALVNGAAYVVAATYNSGTGDLWVNSEKLATAQALGTLNMTGLRLGADYNKLRHFQGRIGEVVIFDKVLSDIEIVNMNAYLSEKWGLNNPDNISDLKAWFDASESTNFTFDTGGLVETWFDKSGNGYEINQTDGTRRPSFVESAQNGLSAIRFDGTNDQLEPSDALAENTNYSIFMMVARNNSAGNQYILGSASNTNFRLGYEAQTLIRYQHNGNSLDIAVGAFDNRAYEVLEVHFSTTSGMTVFRDGTQVGNTGYTTQMGTWSSPYFCRHVGDYCNSDFGEVIFYSRALSSAERTRVYNYLIEKWAP